MNEVLEYRARTLARNTVWGTRDLLARPTAAWRVLPDYLIIGAQRCGTTSLQDLISSHPDVRPPFLRKGIHYFDTDFRRGEAWYRSQFPYRRGGRRLTGEASPYYLFHPLVPGRIAEMIPKVKVIALVRDPVERAISHYKHEVRRGFEHLDMAAAFEREDERLAGEEDKMIADPAYLSPDHQHFSYQARGMYADQLARYEALLPGENISVIESESFWRDPTPVLEQTYQFLGLDRWTPPVVPHLNATRPREVPEGVVVRLRERFASANRRLLESRGIGSDWT